MLEPILHISIIALMILALILMASELLHRDRQIKDLEHSLGKSDVHRKELTEDRDDAAKSALSWGTFADDRQKEIDKMHIQIKDLINSRDAARESLISQGETAGRRQLVINKMEVEITELIKANKQGEDEMRELPDAKEAMMEMVDTLKVREATIDQLQDLKLQLVTEVMALKSRGEHNKVGELRVRVEYLEDEISYKKKDLLEASRKVKGLKVALLVSETAISRLKDQKLQLTTEVMALKSHVRKDEDLEKQLAAAHVKADDLFRSRAKMMEEIAAAKKEAGAKVRSYDDLFRAHVNLKNALIAKYTQDPKETL